MLCIVKKSQRIATWPCSSLQVLLFQCLLDYCFTFSGLQLALLCSSRVFCTPPRHQPPTFSATMLQVLCTHHNSRSLKRAVRRFVFILLLSEFARRHEREPRTLLGELFYIHAINVSAQTHTGARRALASFVVWDAPDCSKRQRAAGEREECLSLPNDSEENEQI